MFLGQFRHNLDDKGRLTVPARYREDLLSDGAYVMLGLDHNLLLLTSPQFAQVSQRLNSMNLADPNARAIRRLIFSTAEQVELDKAGRILISNNLRNLASIDTEAVMVGTGNSIEIWSPGLWDAQMKLLEDAEANATRFAALDLSSS
ncbi:MAG: mraZ [Chloroflexi bacterium]|jgi:MraZ protein|nr:mraZ [Chloroflexota bacterium]